MSLKRNPGPWRNLSASSVPCVYNYYIWGCNTRTTVFYSFSNTIVQYTCVVTNGACATVKGLEEHQSTSPVDLSEKEVNEGFYPAEGRVSSLTILTLLARGPLTFSTVVSILTVWMGEDAFSLQNKWIYFIWYTSVFTPYLCLAYVWNPFQSDVCELMFTCGQRQESGW